MISGFSIGRFPILIALSVFYMISWSLAICFSWSIDSNYGAYFIFTAFLLAILPTPYLYLSSDFAYCYLISPRLVFIGSYCSPDAIVPLPVLFLTSIDVLTPPPPLLYRSPSSFTDCLLSQSFFWAKRIMAALLFLKTLLTAWLTLSRLFLLNLTEAGVG